MEAGMRDLPAGLVLLISETAKFDVKFVVGDEEKETFGANSLILSAASEVLDKNFYGEFEKPSIEDPLIVEIPDGTPDGFRVVLQYIYSDRADLTVDNVISVLYLSKKYLLTNLYQRAVEFALSQINASTILQFLPVSELFDELQDKCIEVVDKNAVAVLASKEFLKLSASLLSRLLSRDTLEIGEMAVYNRAIDWAKERIREEGKSVSPGAIRKTLGNLLYLIRFPTMDCRAFAKGPEAAKILTKQARPRISPIPPHPCKSHGVYCRDCYVLKTVSLYCMRNHPDYLYCPKCRKNVPDYYQRKGFDTDDYYDDSD
ncbi:BTB/POZ domain-containing protein 6-A [Aphelenchoides avenae]|nr:BTB/POZ domain-containing protein 6-A [Aphelenchus avenae]KAH7714090.1 BTB/POZ domain-containing protein 6-A [Aphelenchus avenae]